MPIPLIPVGVGLVVSASIANFVRRKWKKKAVGMTPRRREIYDAALKSLKDSQSLRTLGSAYKAAGLSKEGELLEKRAALRDLPPETKERNSKLFKDAMASTDATHVLSQAQWFDDQGATGAAAALRRYAAGLTKTDGKAAPSIIPPSTPIVSASDPSVEA